MTVAVTNDHTDWFDFDSAPTPNHFGGFASGDGIQTVFKVEGTSSLNNLVNNTGLSGMGHSKGATTISGHMHAWCNCLDIPDTEANRGWAIRITGGTTFGSNYASFNAGGIDTSRIAVQRFQPFVVDVEGTPDASASPPALSSVQCVWMECLLTTNSGQKTVYFDHVFFGTKSRFQGGINAGAAGDSATAAGETAAIPIFIDIGGTYFVLDGLDIGVNNATAQFWQDNNETWVFEGFPNISTTFYTVTFVGGTGTTHSVIFGTKNGTGIDATGTGGNTFIAGGDTPFNFVITDANLDAAGLYGCILNNAAHEDGKLNMTVGEAIGNQFAGMGQITLDAGTGNAIFTRNGVTDSVTAATGLEEAAINLGTTKPASNSFRFVTVEGASRYGLRIEGTATLGDSWDLDDIVVGNSGTADVLVDYPAQTGGNKVTINLNGTSALNSTTQVAVTGGIALADVVVASSVPITITVQDATTLLPVQNAQCSIYLQDTPFTELMNEDSLVTGIATESYGGSTPVNIKWRVRKSDDLDSPRYVPASGLGSIAAGTGFSTTVLLERSPLL